MSKFVNKLVQHIKGDDPESKASKLKSRIVGSLKGGIAALEDESTIEEEIEKAQEAVDLAFITIPTEEEAANEGKTIKAFYIEKLLIAQNNLEEKLDERESRKKSLTFLQGKLKEATEE